VTNVIISDSASTHSPFSFNTVDGSGAQLHTVPVGAADTISIVFSEAVNVSAESLRVVGMRTFNAPTLAEFSYDASTYTAVWRFEGWMVLGDQYLITLSEQVTDADSGNWLDGEWINPATTTTINSSVSTFPSGDGAPGGAFQFVMNLMPGDANLDGVVDSTDYNILSLNYTGVNRLFTQADFNGDGVVNGLDFSLLGNNYNVNRTSLDLKGDFDGDWDVDEDDLMVIADNALMTGATWADGDLNGDGSVTMDDLDLAMAQYGSELTVVS
jgi:hypothetical protein